MRKPKVPKFSPVKKDEMEVESIDEENYILR